MDNCCSGDNGFYMEDHFDLVDYGDQKIRLEYKTFHCNACGKELDLEDLKDKSFTEVS
tara:strand:+ start:146 stop:319 length:174 start_codon:yes stop_codon:yes gene_type:complete